MTVALITASAGTGKTQRLVDEIERALTDPQRPLAPEHLVAVTYTRRAAAELDERLRRRLISVGRVDLAHQLAAARIGTVHAVCQRLVEEFAFELGLSPELRTLDERLSTHALSEVLASVLTDKEQGALDDLSQRMDDLDGFTETVKTLVDFARAQGLDAEALSHVAHRSRERLRELLPSPVGDAYEIEQAFVTAIERALSRAGPEEDGGPWERDLRTARQVLHALKHDHPVPWSRWLSLFRIGPSAQAHVFHPQLREDLLRAHDLIYSAAARGLEDYASRKRAWGVVDFVDQEIHALTLLSRADLRERLADEIRFVLVDEVQDTSPQQLEIFRALGRIAERSLWVGDRKQSIFGFRGADPTVLDEAIVHDVSTLPDPLTISRRSRAPLVALTSAVFGRAFAKHDPASGDARLDSATDADDELLGPFLEWWDASQVRTDEAAARSSLELAIARGILGLVGEDGARVRDRDTGQVRPAGPADIAVLVRRNTTARRVARALEDAGLPAVLRRSGLGRSLEARIVRAGLALWLDGGDRLAAAELARALEDEPPDAFMGRAALPNGFVETIGAHVRTAAERERGAGVVRALDAVIHALDLHAWCARVDEGEQRAANLAALRALAVRTVEEGHAQGRGATLAGFIARLDELRRSRAATDDDQVGLVDAGDAVHIVTWHGAKGLEWPIVVLAETDYRRPPSLFGLATEHEGASRWPRCWPSPYRDRQAWIRGGLFERMKDTPEAARARAASDAEELRLLYVAWTRARDRLVIAGGPRDLERGPVALLDPPPLGRRTRWAGVEVSCAVRRLVDAQTAPAPRRQPTDWIRPTQAFDDLAFIQPSAAMETGEVVEEVLLGDPLPVGRFPDPEEATRLGVALHAIFGAWNAWSAETRVELVVGSLARQQVTGILDVESCLQAAERLYRFSGSRLAQTSTRTEVPLAHALDSGAIVRGQIDLLVISPDSAAVIDHKTYVADLATSRTLAAGFAGQLRRYAAGVTAAGTQVSSLWIHMPIAGRVYRVA